jgi:hypothetical protein
MNIKLNAHRLLMIAIVILASLTLYWVILGSKALPTPSGQTPLGVSSVALPLATQSIDPAAVAKLPALHNANDIRASTNTSLTLEQAQITGISLGVEQQQTDEILREVVQMNNQIEQLLSQAAVVPGLSSLDADVIIKASQQLIAQVDEEYGLDSVAFGQQWRGSLTTISDPELLQLNKKRLALDEELETIANSFQ